MNEKCIGNYIGLVRDYKMIKQEMLALDVNISRPMLSKIENGLEDCNLELMSKIFNVLGICLEEYEGGKRGIQPT